VANTHQGSSHLVAWLAEGCIQRCQRSLVNVVLQEWAHAAVHEDSAHARQLMVHNIHPASSSYILKHARWLHGTP
jgi:hypothetical protein